MATGRFVAYYRVSTAEQGRSGLGLEAQRAAVRAYLDGGHWTLLGEFTEVESGKRAKRDAAHRCEGERPSAFGWIRRVVVCRQIT